MGKSNKIGKLTYRKAFISWKRVEHITIPSKTRFKIKRAWFTNESGDHDPAFDGVANAVGKRKQIKAMDNVGVMLSDNYYYPFFVLTRIKPTKSQ